MKVNTKVLKFHFYANKGLLSYLIRLRTGGVYSHVGVEVDDFFYHSQLGKGVICIGEQYPDVKKTISFEVPEDKIEEIKHTLNDLVGRDYDVLSLGAFMFNINAQDDSAFFCSELCRLVLVHIIGPFPVAKKLVSPERFHEQVVMYKVGHKNGVEGR